MSDIRSRIRLLLAGLSFGDCAGATSEFCDLPQVSRLYATHRADGWPFKVVGGGAFDWRAGQPTDDTDLALCIVRSFVRSGGFDPDDLAKAFVEWLDTNPRDVGGTTRSTIQALRGGKPWYRPGLDLYRQNPSNSANGGLMRNGVIAGFADDLHECFRLTLCHSILTHADPLSVICCLIQTSTIYELLHRDGELPIDDWRTPFAERFGEWIETERDPIVQLWRSEVGQPAIDKAFDVIDAADFTDEFDPFDAEQRRVGQGYSLLTLQIGFWALRWAMTNEPYSMVPTGLPLEPFNEAGVNVIGWVALIGRDSDTYGAVAGPMVAAMLGEMPPTLSESLEALTQFDSMWPRTTSRNGVTT